MAQATQVRQGLNPQAQKLSIIVSKGSLDMAYPAFMLANAGAAMGMEVHLFFTFWGMAVINKRQEANLQVGPDASPGMTTAAVRDAVARLKLPTIPEMVAGAKDMGVHLHACSTTLEMMGMRKDDLVPEVEDIVGASTFLQLSENGQTLFI
ncbi:MAG: DsrE/DsrF/DrsH-like family protein [Nitrososphaerota archaeon]|nr:DsrE/DsrF/DrsH-like family protein [Nitrososphaerota archaeon]MDG6966445.1 DsrE/DsrF/DrsH-like family protein [Nitrososphaerota archaeon]MDG6979137.1 DsrE/DsrF/DrsH-like family protein [Nitrososphaerota archaeon]MDG7020879.1 DsrE/DsrF/DrsH-like family protein [Nitrososphaerota archaeon]